MNTKVDNSLVPTKMDFINVVISSPVHMLMTNTNDVAISFNTNDVAIPFNTNDVAILFNSGPEKNEVRNIFVNTSSV